MPRAGAFYTEECESVCLRLITKPTCSFKAKPGLLRRRSDVLFNVSQHSINNVSVLTLSSITLLFILKAYTNLASGLRRGETGKMAMYCLRSV